MKGHIWWEGRKKDWNCLGMHFCPKNIRILCGGHAQQKKRNALCSQPFSSDMVCFDAMQHSTVVSSSIPRASWWSASGWSCHILWARSSVYGYHRCHKWQRQQRRPEIIRLPRIFFSGQRSAGMHYTWKWRSCAGNNGWACLSWM